jgi:hypothetical protein
MFLGHYGLALAAKRAAPRASLGVLVLAAQLADLLWPLLLLAGAEQLQVTHGATPLLNLVFTSYPYSHSLLTQLALGALLGIVYFAARRKRREAMVVGLLVPSHWLLDWLVHVPDLPLFPGDAERHGLGLWQSLPLTLTCEFAVLGPGLALYLTATRARDGIGRWALAGMIGFLVLVYLYSLASGPPPSADMVAWSALLLWLLPLWAYWADRHRSTRVATP